MVLRTRKGKSKSSGKKMKAKTTQMIGSQPKEKNLQLLISERAYELFQNRGCVHGFDREDWIQAENQVSRELHLKN